MNSSTNSFNSSLRAIINVSSSKNMLENLFDQDLKSHPLVNTQNDANELLILNSSLTCTKSQCEIAMLKNIEFIRSDLRKIKITSSKLVKILICFKKM